MTVLTTRRVAIAHVSVCVGCCCGRVDPGKPAVPVDWLKAEWKAHKLLKHVHLTISGCLGPCDLVNVVSVASERGTTWPGGLDCFDDFDDFAALAGWAVRVARQERLLPLPPALEAHVFQRFHPAYGATREELV